MSDDTIISMLPPGNSETRTNTAVGSREEWLAQLEDAAFALQDNSLRRYMDDDLPSTEENTVTASHNQSFVLNAARHQSIAELQRILTSGVGPNTPVGMGLSGPGPAYAPVNPAAIAGNAPPAPAINNPSPQTSPSKPTATPNLQQLINRLQFSDLNVTVTNRGDEMTLWVRDFKQKYATELFHWIKDLGQFLQGSGKSLSRIMVNGEQINHVNELLGGGKWQ